MDTLDWQSLAKSGDMVAAIKTYRVSTGTELAEAKQAVENWVNQNIPLDPRLELALRLCERATDLISSAIHAADASINWVVQYDLERQGLTSRQSGIYSARVSCEEGSCRTFGVRVRSRPASSNFFDRIFDDLRSGTIVCCIVLSITDPDVIVYTEPSAGTCYHGGATVDLTSILPNGQIEVRQFYEGLGIEST